MWEKIGPFLTYIGPLILAIAALLFSVVLWGAFTLAGGQPGFKRSLATVSHAMLPVAVAALLAVPVVLSLDSIGADRLETGSFLQSSLASFASEDTGPVMLALLSKLDVFTLWTVILLAIGFRYAAGVSPSTAASASARCRSREASTSGTCASAQTRMAWMGSRSDEPSGVSEYSTRGGESA